MDKSKRALQGKRSGPVSTERLEEIFRNSVLPRAEEAVGFLLWRTQLTYQRRAEEVLAGAGLTHLQFAVLATAGFLSRAGDEVSQRDLVKQSGIKEAQVSFMVKALRLKGMLLQQPGINDPRVRAIRLTDHGARSLELAIPLINAIQNQLWPTRTMQREMAKVLRDALERWDVSFFESSAASKP